MPDTTQRLHRLIADLPDAAFEELESLRRSIQRTIDKERLARISAQIAELRASIENLGREIAALRQELDARLADDPLGQLLVSAPVDDEPETDQEHAAVAEAHRERTEGRHNHTRVRKNYVRE